MSFSFREQRHSIGIGSNAITKGGRGRGYGGRWLIVHITKFVHHWLISCNWHCFVQCSYRTVWPCLLSFNQFGPCSVILSPFGPIWLPLSVEFHFALLFICSCCLCLLCLLPFGPLSQTLTVLQCSSQISTHWPKLTLIDSFLCSLVLFAWLALLAHICAVWSADQWRLIARFMPLAE